MPPPVAERPRRFHHWLVAVAQVHPVGQQLVDPYAVADPPKRSVHRCGGTSQPLSGGHGVEQGRAYGRNDQRPRPSVPVFGQSRFRANPFPADPPPLGWPRQTGVGCWYWRPPPIARMAIPRAPAAGILAGPRLGRSATGRGGDGRPPGAASIPGEGPLPPPERGGRTLALPRPSP